MTTNARHDRSSRLANDPNDLARGQRPADLPPSSGVGGLLRAWRHVLRHPAVSTFDRYRTEANWPTLWLSLLPLAIVEALGVAYAAYGPAAAAGYSSLPIGPKLHLPPTPLLPLAALFGSVAQFFVFAGLLTLSARLFGGHGAFKTQAYLIALFWIPLMLASDIVELIPTVGPFVGPLIRLYALYLCALALASAQRLSISRAWAALLLPVAAGVLLGVVVLVTLGPHLSGLVGAR